MPRHKLLLADDSATIQKVVNLTFAEEGIDVIAFGDGASAWIELGENIPDLVMADVHMPGMTGYELCQKIRSDETLKHLPVLLLVGSFEPFDEAEAARVGANGYLTKPFQSIKQLLAQVRELIAPPDHPAVFEETLPLDVEAAPEAEPEEDLTETRPLDSLATAVGPDAPSTSDIDSLYLQSLENTAEMETPPAMADGDGLGDVSTDDSLIDTIPAWAEPAEFLPEEVLSELNADGQKAELADSPALDLEPASTGATPQTHGPISVSPFDITISDEVPAAGGNVPSDVEQAMPQFEETIPDELPLPPFAAGDILDIPDASTVDSPPPVENSSSNGGSSVGSPLNVSPELLDLIVQKVIERLEEKQDRGSDPAFR